MQRAQAFQKPLKIDGMKRVKIDDGTPPMFGLGRWIGRHRHRSCGWRIMTNKEPVVEKIAV